MATVAHPVTLDPGRFRLLPPGAVKRLGLIVLSTDLTSERDAARLLPPGRVALHVGRVAFENPTTPENLVQMAPRLTEAARLLVPGCGLSAICYSCTSGSVVIGDEAVEEAIAAAHPGVPVVTPTRAALAAFAALRVRRIALVTPYLPETTAPMAAYFAARGIDVASTLCFGFADDRDMARIARDSIPAGIAEADTREADAVFVSCTALPSLEVVTELEERLGKPVVTSNQASLWLLRHHVGLVEDPGGFGRLFQTAPATEGVA